MYSKQATAMQRVVHSSMSNQNLHLIVLPTEGCNFRCTYCYEEFRLSRMKREVREGLARFIQKRASNLKRLNLSWFGGEPLLAYDIILDLLHTVERVRAEKPDLEFVSEMTTNGYNLTVERFQELLGLGVTRYQISLDGPQAEHDKRRVKANGEGTFEQIWNNLLSFREIEGDFEVVLRLHVDRDNLFQIPSVIREIAENFGGDSRFKLFIRPISKLGGQNDEKLPILEGEDIDAAMNSMKKLAKELNVSLFGQDDEGPTVCYATRANSFVVRSDGRLNKCTVALEKEENQVGRILPDGTLKIERDLMVRWMRGLFSEDTEELECPLVGIEKALRLEKAAS